ncbi:response regulator [Desertivirga xinjiangensis]|uniref:response regulator n=1 Tax=Desertivirga xinjiangensis TaxID=539206 RepID=UPI00210871BB|nr:response regulator [Pedobacter xinjiangensis]
MSKEIKIMIADDDLGIVDAVEMLLEYKGYLVSTASENTLARIMEELPDVLLLDIWMSGEDGLEICRTLKSQKLTKDIPIVMISASKDIEHSAMHAGADDFLAKPFEMTHLLDKIDLMLKRMNNVKSF